MASSNLPTKIIPPLGQRSVQWTLIGLMMGTMVAVTLQSAFIPDPRQFGEPRSERGLLRVDLNQAPAHELSLLPGIGPARAEQIVIDRQRNGDYLSIEDLQRINGIGPKTIRQIESVCVVQAAQN